MQTVTTHICLAGNLYFRYLAVEHVKCRNLFGRRAARSETAPRQQHERGPPALLMCSGGQGLVQDGVRLRRAVSVGVAVSSAIPRRPTATAMLPYYR